MGQHGARKLCPDRRVDGVTGRGPGQRGGLGGKNPVGTGPFKFVNWKLGNSISYTRFDGYWQQGKPYLDGVQISTIADDLTREISLRAGEIDGGALLITTNFAKLKGDGFVVITRPSGVGDYSLIPDSANAKSPFADVRVRQAANYAIDNAALIKSVYGDGGASFTNQLTYPGYWAYNPSIVGYPYDPAKAKQLLTAAGYPNGFQTKLQSGNTLQQSTYASGVQAYLKAVGIDAPMEIQSNAQQNDYQIFGKSWEGLAVAKWTVDPDWVSVASAYYLGNGCYVSMIVPADDAQAINNALLAPDFATKQKFAQQAMQLMVDIRYADSGGCSCGQHHLRALRSQHGIHGNGKHHMDA